MTFPLALLRFRGKNDAWSVAKGTRAMWVQQVLWVVEVVGWWIPLIVAAGTGWWLLKNVKAVLVISAVAAVLTYLVWGLPGSGIAPINLTPERPAARVEPPPVPAYVPLSPRPSPAPQHAAQAPQPHCYFYNPIRGAVPRPPPNFPADLDPTKPARWCDPPAQP